MTVAERALAIDRDGRRLVAVLAEPAPDAAGGHAGDIGMVVVVGGPQYRVGAHRQFVTLARRVAAAGHPVLRFDVAGMGDSEGDPPHFERTGADIGAAIDALVERVPTVRRVVLWGLCDGASAALLYLEATRDRRVRGLCLLNPWVRTASIEATVRVRHYYLDRLRDPAFWRKLLGGGVARTALSDAWRSVRAMRGAAAAGRCGPGVGGGGGAGAPYVERMAAAWRAFDGAVLLLLSERDYTAREFVAAATSQSAWRGALQHRGLTRHDLADADHTFSGPGSAQQADALLVEWLARLAGSAGGGASR